VRQWAVLSVRGSPQSKVRPYTASPKVEVHRTAPGVTLNLPFRVHTARCAVGFSAAASAAITA